MDEKGQNTFTCVYCWQTYKGRGINRMKQHLAGIKGDIGSCKKVSHDVRNQMLEYLKEFELKKKAEKQRQEEMFSVSYHVKKLAFILLLKSKISTN